MKFSISLKALLLLFIASRSAFGFGALGHQVVAALAEDMLTPAAHAAIAGLLAQNGADTSGSKLDLPALSTWADDIKRERPETRPWHYIDLELDTHRIDSTASHAVKTDTPNVISVLQREFKILSDHHADHVMRFEALKWAVHLTADLHQPLHVGEDHDKGGNLQKVKVNRRMHNLHEVWDYILIERLNLGFDELHLLLRKEMTGNPAFLQGNAHGTVEDWANETYAKARACYLLHGRMMRKNAANSLDREYLDAATAVVLIQLKIASVRLAWALNAAFDAGAAPPPPTAHGPQNQPFPRGPAPIMRPLGP